MTRALNYCLRRPAATAQVDGLHHRDDRIVGIVESDGDPGALERTCSERLTFGKDDVMHSNTSRRRRSRKPLTFSHQRPSKLHEINGLRTTTFGNPVLRPPTWEQLRATDCATGAQSVRIS